MHKACPLSELAPGEALRLDSALPIAVFHMEDGELFAIDDTCTHHQDASLADGYVEDCRAEWPVHPSRFNLQTGKIEVIDGDLMVIKSKEAPTFLPA